MKPPLPPRPLPVVTAAELLIALAYELLDAHLDTIDLTAELPEDAWRAHLDYLRALERTGRTLLAQTQLAELAR